MSTGLVLIVIVAVVVLLAVFFVIGIYNRLVRFRNRYKNASRLATPRLPRGSRRPRIRASRRQCKDWHKRNPAWNGRWDVCSH